MKSLVRIFLLGSLLFFGGSCQEPEVSNHYRALLINKWAITTLKSKILVKGNNDAVVDTNLTSEKYEIEFLEDGTFTSDINIFAYLKKYAYDQNKQISGRYTYINGEVKLVYKQVPYDISFVNATFFTVNVTEESLTLRMDKNQYIKSRMETEPTFYKYADWVTQADGVVNLVSKE